MVERSGLGKFITDRKGGVEGVWVGGVCWLGFGLIGNDDPQ